MILVAVEGRAIRLRGDAWLCSQFASGRGGGGSSADREVEQWASRGTRESAESDQAPNSWASRIRAATRESGERSLITRWSDFPSLVTKSECDAIAQLIVDCEPNRVDNAADQDAMNEPAPVNLHFEDSGQWYSLPEWADYFIGVGKQLALAPQKQSRIVTAIVVPTRAFGAAFVSLGMVISDAAARDQASEAAHFERLSDLPQCTPVVYRPRKGAALKGVLEAPGEYRGKLCVSVRVHSKEGGGKTFLIFKSEALKVQPTGGQAWELPKKQGLHNARTANTFVDSLLGETDPVQLGLRSKLVCTLVGRRNTLLTAARPMQQ